MRNEPDTLRPMPGPTSLHGRRPRLLVVASAVLAAALTVGWSTSYLLREPVGVTEAAIARPVQTVTPQDPVPPERSDGLHLYLVPHPDDELSGWSSLIDTPDLHPVIVVLTEGEATSRCDGDRLGRYVQAELGEVVPDPVPSGQGSPECRQARLGSFRSALQESERHAPALVGLSDTASERIELPTGAGMITAGEHATVVTLDLGDSSLAAGDVVAAATELLEDRGRHLPDLPLARVTAAAYVGVEEPVASEPPCDLPAICPAGDRAFVYERPDHIATHEAGRALAPLAAQGSWLVTHPYDAAAAEHRALPQDLYDDFMALGPGEGRESERRGTYQRIYGWLAFPDVWRVGDLPLDSGQVLFPRIQSYEVVAP